MLKSKQHEQVLSHCNFTGLACDHPNSFNLSDGIFVPPFFVSLVVSDLLVCLLRAQVWFSGSGLCPG